MKTIILIVPKGEQDSFDLCLTEKVLAVIGLGVNAEQYVGLPRVQAAGHLVMAGWNYAYSTKPSASGMHYAARTSIELEGEVQHAYFMYKEE